MTKPNEGVEDAKNGGKPNPTFEDDPKNVSLPGAEDIMNQLKSLDNRLNEMDKRWQSDKDRRIPQIENEVSDIRKVLGDYAALVENDVNPELAKWLIERVGDRVGQAEQNHPQTTQASHGREPGKDVVTEAIGKLEQFDLDANAPDFIDVLRGTYANEDAFNSKVNEYILDKVKPGKSTPGAAGLTSGAANEDVDPQKPNPIEDIEDAKTLYDLGMKQIMKGRRTR